MSKELAGSKVVRQSCVNLLWLLRNRMSELDTYGSVGVLSGNRPFYPDTWKNLTYTPSSLRLNFPVIGDVRLRMPRLYELQTIKIFNSTYTIPS